LVHYAVDNVAGTTQLLFLPVAAAAVTTTVDL
jgi:hypothetical protein